MSETEQVETAAAEVFSIARCLFVTEPAAAERMLAWAMATDADPGRLGDLTGKYLKREGGYIQIRPTGEGAYLRELPPGVAPDAIVTDPVDVTGATPLQDRLRAIADELASLAGERAGALVAAIGRILAACEPENEVALTAEVKRAAGRVLFEPEIGGDLPARGQAWLDQLSELVEQLRAAPAASGVLLGSALAIEALIRTGAEQAGDLTGPTSWFGEALGFVCAPSAAPLPAIAQGLSQRVARTGRSAIARAAAERVKAQGDDLIAAALDGGLIGFHPHLYKAASYEFAAWLLAGGAAEAGTLSPEERYRWQKLGVNAEERHVRIQTSLAFAVRNRDGALAGRDRAVTEEIRAREGDAAARQAATDLALNEFRYPKAMIPVLLGEQSYHEALEAKR